MELVAIVTVLAAIQAFWLAFQVGQARIDAGVKAPNRDGPDAFMRADRVHQNTIEQLVVVLPAMWVFAYYVHHVGAAALGMLFIIGRFVYRSAYLKDPASRGPGFIMGALVFTVLALGGLIGAGMRLLG